MKVLLTGANGFVGSHVLDQLQAQELAVALLLRKGSHTHHIAGHLSRVTVHYGSLEDLESLRPALENVTHVIHCAGCTKALCPEEYYRVNQLGTRHLVAALNRWGGAVERLVHLSSLAAMGPATAGAPAHEDDTPHPVSAYGGSKLAAELEVRSHCRAAHVILRPPGVYGPRDREFLALFRTVAAHVRPLLGGGRQPLSLVCAPDLARVVVKGLSAPGAAGRAYHVAAPEVVTAGELARQVAQVLGVRTMPLPLPTAALWPVCVLQELRSRLTRQPSVLSRQRYAELRAAGWVCATERLRDEWGEGCPTPLAEGLRQTAAWYRQEGWL